MSHGNIFGKDHQKLFWVGRATRSIKKCPTFQTSVWKLQYFCNQQIKSLWIGGRLEWGWGLEMANLPGGKLKNTQNRRKPTAQMTNGDVGGGVSISRERKMREGMGWREGAEMDFAEQPGTCRILSEEQFRARSHTRSHGPASYQYCCFLRRASHEP